MKRPKPPSGCPTQAVMIPMVMEAHRFDEKPLYTKGHVAYCEAPERSRYCANSAICVASFLKSTSSSMLFLMSPTMAARDTRDSSGLMYSNTLQTCPAHLRTTSERSMHCILVTHTWILSLRCGAPLMTGRLTFCRCVLPLPVRVLQITSRQGTRSPGLWQAHLPRQVLTP